MEVNTPVGPGTAIGRYEGDTCLVMFNTVSRGMVYDEAWQEWSIPTIPVRPGQVLILLAFPIHTVDKAANVPNNSLSTSRQYGRIKTRRRHEARKEKETDIPKENTG